MMPLVLIRFLVFLAFSEFQFPAGTCSRTEHWILHGPQFTVIQTPKPSDQSAQLCNQKMRVSSQIWYSMQPSQKHDMWVCPKIGCPTGYPKHIINLFKFHGHFQGIPYFQTKGLWIAGPGMSGPSRPSPPSCPTDFGRKSRKHLLLSSRNSMKPGSHGSCWQVAIKPPSYCDLWVCVLKISKSWLKCCFLR